MKYVGLKWLEIALTLSTMFGENFEICWPQMARNTLKLFTMVGEKFEIR